MKVLLAIALMGFATATETEGNTAIRNIVSQLQTMQGKTEKDLAQEAKLHEEEQELCRSDIQGAGYNIDDAKAALDDAKARIEKNSGEIAQAKSDIANFASGIQQNGEDLAAAHKLNKEKTAMFEAGQTELQQAIGILAKAANVISKASKGSGSAGTSAKLKAMFAQVAQSLSSIVQSAFIETAKADKLTAFIQAHKEGDDDAEEEDAAPKPYNPEVKAYESHTGGIVDLLAEIKQDAEKELNEMRMEELKRVGEFNLLRQSLEDNTKVQETGMEDSKANLAGAQEGLSQAQADEAEQQKEFDEQTAYKATREQACEANRKEYAASKADGEAEVKALGEAIGILSGASGALDRQSFLQMGTSDDSLKQEIVSVLRRSARKAHSIALAQLALRVGQDPFGKVKGMIEDMITKLQKQKAEETTKKAWCDEETKKGEAKRDATTAKLERTAGKLEKATADLAMLKADIADLGQKTADLQKSMAAANKLRTEEAQNYAATMSDCSEGLKALADAIAVLREYYSSESASNTDSGNGVIQFLEVAETDLNEKKTTGEQTESSAQAEFTTLKNESEVSLATWESSRKGKESEVARLGSSIEDLNGDQDSQQETLDSTVASLKKIREACTHQVESFEERHAKMKAEIEGLEEALSLLDAASEAPESFLQRRRI